MAGLLHNSPASSKSRTTNPSRKQTHKHSLTKHVRPHILECAVRAEPTCVASVYVFICVNVFVVLAWLAPPLVSRHLYKHLE